jgi:phosphotriesterase-related protein
VARIARTVLGDISEDDLGITLTHEHLILDVSVWYSEPTDPDARRYMDQEPTLDTIWWFRQFPASNQAMMRLTDVELAIAEVVEFRIRGGRTIVEMTNQSIGRDADALVRISRATGVNVIASTGYYIDPSHTSWLRSAPIDEIAASMVHDIEEGIGETQIRAGIIGEIGVSEPMTESEVRVLRAAAAAHRVTGAAISIHNAAVNGAKSGDRVAGILESEGVDLSRVIMGHMESSIDSPAHHRDLAQRGCYLSFDMFGQDEFESGFPYIHAGDPQRTRAVRALVDDGYGRQILLSHDVCYRLHLQRYGGYGYAHLLRNVRLRFRHEGMEEEIFWSIMTDNPRDVIPLRPE